MHADKDQYPLWLRKPHGKRTVSRWEGLDAPAALQTGVGARDSPTAMLLSESTPETTSPIPADSTEVHPYLQIPALHPLARQV